MILDDGLKLQISQAVEVGEAAFESDETVLLHAGDINMHNFKDA